MPRDEHGVLIEKTCALPPHDCGTAGTEGAAAVEDDAMDTEWVPSDKHTVGCLDEDDEEAAGEPNRLELGGVAPKTLTAVPLGVGAGASSARSAGNVSSAWHGQMLKRLRGGGRPHLQHLLHLLHGSWSR